MSVCLSETFSTIRSLKLRCLRLAVESWGGELLRGEQTLCCKICIKLWTVQAKRFLYVLQHTRAQLPSSLGMPFGRTLSTSGRSRFWISVIVAVRSCEQSWGAPGGQMLLQEGLGKRWPERQSTRTILGKNKMPRGGVFLKCNTFCVVHCDI